jgi:hypothetical protein
MKTDQKSIFDPCDVHILARLDITVMYTIIFEVLKNIKFQSAFDFTHKRLSTVKMV